MRVSYAISAKDLLLEKGTIVENVISNNRFRKIGPDIYFDRLKQVGVDGIQLGIPNKFTKDKLKKVVKHLSKYNVKILSIHQPIRLLSHSSIDEVEQVFRFAKDIKASLVTLHSDMAGKQLLDVHYIHKIKSLENKYKIYACFENMQYHHLFFRNKLFWHRQTFQKLIKANNLNVTFDTTHAGQAKYDIVDFFLENKRNIKIIHLSDYLPHLFGSSLLPNYNMHMPLGHGSLPIKKFLQTLRKEKYNGDVTMEIVGNIDDICESAKIIRQYAGN